MIKPEVAINVSSCKRELKEKFILAKMLPAFSAVFYCG